jgi:hypothetical protein
MEVTVYDTVCTVTFDKYQVNNANAIMLTEKETGEPYMTASVNIPNYPVDDNQVCIKNYSENTGILETLTDAGIIKPIKELIPNVHLCDILKTKSTK